MPASIPDPRPGPSSDPVADPISEARRQWIAHGWTDAADGMAMVTSLVRAHQLLMERIDAVLRPLDLSFARYEVLRLLAFTRSGAMPMTRLGSLLQVHPTSVTSAVGRLVKQGFAARERGPHDGRVVLASITPAGRDVVDLATERLNAELFAAPGISVGETAQLTALLGALRAASGDDVPHD
ncbi:MarR family transcriptional regulator [Nocardioides sp. Y6]|uniref:MarR family transcriptional regulator n=1 Tax=Nocardioides malaquae TaxID=2773426 RepID=A0ABR9RTP0_9ACTN|nr:MarR family transcriptional regulator [Nocardioides malaquae]MBE7324740.1 MarR family transcriptional regulator [Nocardioides malaquae]